MTKKIMIDWEEQENVEWHDFRPAKKPGGKRNLLITTDNFLPRWDGIARFLSEIVPRLKDSYDITIACPDYGHVHIEGVEIVQIPLWTRVFGDYTPARFRYAKIRKLVKQADLVFNQALGPIGTCAILAARQCRRPIANYIHSVEWELFPKALASPLFRGPLVSVSKAVVRFFYNRCSLLIVPSENIAEQFSWQRISTPKRIAHLGVDTKKFVPGDTERARERLDLPEGFTIGFHGRIAYEKNLLSLARAFQQVDIPNKRLLIVGDGVLKLKARLEDVPGVTVAGSTNDVVPWLQAMDLYVQPSFTETTSLALLEAMACGLPVITSKVGFIKYYIIDGQNGMFFDNVNTYQLALRIEQLYKDAKRRKRLGSNARKTIEKSFRWENTAEAIKDALDSI